MLKRWNILILLLLLVFPAKAYLPEMPEGGEVSDSVSVMHWLMGSYFNDAHFNTDYYYTFGIQAEYYAPVFKNKIIMAPLLKWPHCNHSTSGIQVVNDAFTPLNISSPEIQIGDRPFAGYLYAGLIRKSYRPEKGLLFTSELDLGVLGPSSGAKQAQDEIHEIIGDPLPHGWKNQIKTDVVLNYNLRLEKRLLERKNLAGLYASAEARVGTLYDDASGGLTLCFGATETFRNNSYVVDKVARSDYKKLHAYFYLGAEARAVGYNATMQGGVFSRDDNVYTLPSSAVEHFVGKGTAGIGVVFRKIILEYTAYRITPEFDGARWHDWSRMKVSFRF